MNMIAFILTILFSIGNDPAEQIAINHFTSDIINRNYPESKAICFSGRTENEQSIAGPFAKCFQSDEDFSQFYYQQKASDAETIVVESASSRLQKSLKTKSKQLNLKIYRAVRHGEIEYVYLKVFKEKHFVDHYLMKISSSKVVDVCQTNEVI